MKENVAVPVTAPPLVNYLPGVDGLRALAVLSVIAYHLDEQFLPGGLTGVDVFFVISGYVISKSLSGIKESTLLHHLSTFYRRRFVRIFPALIACLFISSIIAAIIIPDGYLSRSNTGTAFWAFFGLSNFFLFTESDSYFAASVPFNPFVHTWSLGVEEQFYLLFPALAFYWKRQQPNAAGYRQPVFLLMACLTFASLGYSAHTSLYNPTASFYLLPSRFWELSCGVMLFWMHSCGLGIIKSQLRIALSSFTGLGLVITGFFFTHTVSFPFPYALLPVIGTTLLICAFVSNTESQNAKDPIHVFFSNSSVVFVGLLSFSLYLWHWPIFSFFHWTVGLEGVGERIAAVVLTVFCSVTSYTFIEKPIRYSLVSKSAQNRTIIFISLFAVTLFALATRHLDEHRVDLGVYRSVLNENPCDWKSWMPRSCEIKTPIGFSELSRGRKLISVGDSHEEAYGRMLTLASRAVGANLLRKNITGCKLVWLTPPYEQPCASDLLDWVLEVAEQGDIVFLPGLQVVRLNNAFGALDKTSVAKARSFRESPDQLDLGIRKASLRIAVLRERGVHVLLEAPKPVFRAAPEMCMDWFNKRHPRCAEGFIINRSFVEDHRSVVMSQIEVLKKRIDFDVWDPLPALCDKKLCHAVIDGRPVFKDGDHLSGYGNEILLPSFLDAIDSIWNQAK